VIVDDDDFQLLRDGLHQKRLHAAHRARGFTGIEDDGGDEGIGDWGLGIRDSSLEIGTMVADDTLWWHVFLSADPDLPAAQDAHTLAQIRRMIPVAAGLLYPADDGFPCLGGWNNGSAQGEDDGEEECAV